MKMKKMLTMLMIFTLLCNFLLPAATLAKEEDNMTVAAETKLLLDNQNCYQGMGCSYSEGYSPSVEHGYATIVLPLICDNELKGNQLRVLAELGDAASMPFVCKNYEKTVFLSENAVNNGREKVSGYLVVFQLELSDSRVNGNYPVFLHASGKDGDGNAVSADFTVYVVISDGINPNAPEPEPEPTPEEPVIYTPKVLVKSYECKKIADEEAADHTIAAGDKFELTVNLWNTSTSETLKNTSVTVTSPETGYMLLSPSNTVYIGDFGAGETMDVTFEYQASISVLPGQYDFGINCDYAYGKAAAASATGTAKVTIAQHLNVKFDDLQFPEKVTVSDTVMATLQAMNLGKTTIYNVRAEIEVDGLRPGGTLFIGNIEPGNAGSSSVQVAVSGLSKSDSLYGKSNGKVIYYYEDAEGNEYNEEREFSVSVVSPFSETSQEAEGKPEQWWVIMLIISVVIVSFVVVFMVRVIKRRKQYEMVD